MDTTTRAPNYPFSYLSSLPPKLSFFLSLQHILVSCFKMNSNSSLAVRYGEEEEEEEGEVEYETLDVL